MTEDEARTKWCPHTRVQGFNRNGPLVNDPESKYFRCIASDCMMWEPYGIVDSQGDCGLKRKYNA